MPKFHLVRLILALDGRLLIYCIFIAIFREKTRKRPKYYFISLYFEERLIFYIFTRMF
jgi:hypothetical protein